MKTILALLLLSFFTAAHAQSGERNWDVRLAVGGGTYPYLRDGGRFLDFNIFASEVEKSIHSATIFYQTKNKRLKIGLAAAQMTVGYYHVGIIDFLGGSDTTYLMAEKKITAFMPAVNYSFLATRNSTLYSEADFGLSFTKHQFYDKPRTTHSVAPAFQCTFLGYRFGRRIGVFTELGYGYKGIIQLGVSGAF